MYLPTSVRLPFDAPRSSVTPHQCHGCGLSAPDTRAVSFVYRNGVSFCLACWDALPGPALRQVILDSAERTVLTGGVRVS